MNPWLMEGFKQEAQWDLVDLLRSMRINALSVILGILAVFIIMKAVGNVLLVERALVGWKKYCIKLKLGMVTCLTLNCFGISKDV
ncbi:hypothetical protein D3C81_1890250 [compost metagenome]